jgi:hypothetical protein
MSARSVGVLLSVCLFMATAPAGADTPQMAQDQSANTLPRGSLQLSLFQLSRYGVTDDVEVAAQPFMFVFPQVEVKARWYKRGPHQLAARLRVAYPTFLMRALVGKGALALLPEGTRVPQALMLEPELIGTLRLAPGHELSATLGAAFAPRAKGFEDVPMLDFPFLYARFASLWTFATYHLHVAYHGRLAEHWTLSAGIRDYVLPSERGGFSFEPWIALRLQPGAHVAIELGAIMELTRYPAGRQVHELPYLDLLLLF